MKIVRNCLSLRIPGRLAYKICACDTGSDNSFIERRGRKRYADQGWGNDIDPADKLPNEYVPSAADVVVAEPAPDSVTVTPAAPAFPDIESPNTGTGPHLLPNPAADTLNDIHRVFLLK